MRFSLTLVLLSVFCIKLTFADKAITEVQYKDTTKVTRNL